MGSYQVKIITFKDGGPIAVKKSYLPGVLRLNDPLESIAIRNFPFRISKMYFARRSIYLLTKIKIQQTATGWCSAQPAKSGKSTRKQKIQIFGAKTVCLSNFSSKYKLSSGGFEAEHQTHNLKVAGSIPAISL